MYFEELNPGDKFHSRPRVVTATDIDNFAISTGAVNPLFLDDKFANTMGLDQRIAPGLLTLSLSVGLAYSLGLFGHTIAMVNIEVSFLASVNAGDTIESIVEVTEKRETKDEGRGVVLLKITSHNQTGKPVLEVARFVALQQRRG